MAFIDKDLFGSMITVYREGENLRFVAASKDEPQLHSVLGFATDQVKDEVGSRLGLLFQKEEGGKVHFKIRRPVLLTQLIKLGIPG